VRVLVAYTKAAQERIETANTATTIEGWIDQRIQEANQSLIGSEINKLRFQKAAATIIDYTETGTWTTDRNRFFRNGDGFMDNIFLKRDEVGADVSVLVFNNSTYCGEAQTIGAEATSAFAVVDVSRGCTAKFSFAHEIGHLFGAEHDEANASKPPEYPYSHGYINGNQWRTMMAYAQGCNPCTRLPRWSSPLIQHQGVIMGTKENHDNARVLRDRANVVSGFR
jgi:hypothetical protein